MATETTPETLNAYLDSLAVLHRWNHWNAEHAEEVRWTAGWLASHLSNAAQHGTVPPVAKPDALKALASWSSLAATMPYGRGETWECCDEVVGPDDSECPFCGKEG